jgi:CSLREA domain-containing protein
MWCNVRTTPAYELLDKLISSRILRRCAFLLVLSLSTLVLLSSLTRTGYVKSGAPGVRVHVDSQSRLLNLKEANQTSVDYKGNSYMAEALRSGNARPLALASGDLDSDMAADLITGYRYGDNGIITVRRGKLDAFQTQDEKVYQSAMKGNAVQALESSAEVYSIPEPPTFLAVGDFNGDHQQDVLAATVGGGLYLIAGDGAGDLSDAEQIPLSGQITAIATGVFNRNSELTSVVVAVDGKEGAALLMFEGEDGGLKSQPKRYPLAGRATALALGNLDNDSFGDAAIAEGNTVELIHGGGWNNSDLAARVEQISAPFEVRSLAIGDYIWDREARPELAMLAPDGNVHIYDRGELDTRPFTDADRPARIAQRLALAHTDAITRQQQIEVVESEKWQPEQKQSWSDAQQVAAVSGGGDFSAQTMIDGGHTTGKRTNDLFVMDPLSNQIHLLVDNTTSVYQPTSRSAVTLDVDGPPLALLAMPQQINAARDLMVLNGSHTDAAPIGLAPLATFTVTKTADTNAATCVAGNCSLREAIKSANLTAATNIITFSLSSGTYSNGGSGPTTCGSASANCFPVIGDGSSTNISIVGVDTTPSNTIINNTITGASTGQPVLYYGFAANQTFKLQNVQLQNGDVANTIYPFGGGAFATGGTGWNVTVDNCILTNNKGESTENGGAISHTGGGNFIIQNNTIISSNTATAAVGGGAYLNNGTNPGNLTISNSSFTGNTAGAGAGAGQGGGMFLTVETGSTITVTRATVTNNVAGSQQGGGIYTNKGTIQFSRIVGNTSTSGGSGVHEPGGAFGITANNNWWGCNFGPGATGTGCTGAQNSYQSVTGSPAPTIWLQLRNVISGANVHVQSSNNHIAPGSTATFTGDILGLNTPVGGSTAAGNLTSLATFPTPDAAIYSNSSVPLGSINVTSGHYANGQANSGTTFTSNGTKGTATINSIADNQTEATTLFIGFDPEYVNNSGVDNVTSAFASVACGAGNVPCFQTIGFSLTNVAINGTIHIQASTYNENALFDTPLCQTCVGSIDGAVQLNGTLTIGTATIQGNANTLSLTGDFTKTGGTFTPGTGTVNFNGGTNQTITNNAASLTFNNLTVSKSGGALATGANPTTIVTNDMTMTSGNFTAPATLDINGNTTLTAGNLTAGASITAAKDWTNNGGTFTAGSGTVTFDGATVNQTINGSAASQTFNNFTVNKSGANPLSTGGSTTSIVTNNLTMTLGNFTAPALLDINGNTTLTAGNLTAGANITAAGDWTNNGGTFTPGSGTVSFDGNTVNQTINGSAASQTFNNFTVNKVGANPLSTGGSTVTIHTTDLTITLGNFTAPATLDINGNTTLTAGNLTAGASITAAGNWTNNGGTFTPGSGTVSFDGNTVNQTINGTAASQTFNNFTVNKVGANPLSTGGSTTAIVTNNLTMTLGNFTAPATLDVNGNVLLSAGNLTAGAATTVAGNWSNAGGTFTAGSGLVTFDGSVAQSIGDATHSTTFNDLTISNTGNTVSLLHDISVTGNLSITSGTFDLVGFLANRSVAGGQSSISNGATLKIGGTNGFPTNYNTHIFGATSTVEYESNSAQTITALAEAYGNLTSSGSGGRTLPNGGTVKVFSVFTPGTNVYTITGSTMDFDGDGSQTIPAFSFNNLTISNTRTGTNNVTMVNGGTIKIAGVFTATATFGTGGYVVTNNTVDYNGTVAQSMPSGFTTYNNLTISNNSVAGVTGFSGLVVQGTLQVNAGSKFTSSTSFANVLINGTLAGTNATSMDVSGNWTNNGTFTPNGNTVNFNGSSAQTIGGTATTSFDNLTIANAGSGVTLGHDETVNLLLTLTNDLNTSTFTLTQPSTGTSAGAADVVGNVKRTGFSTTGLNTLSFGNPFNTIQINSDSAPADVISITTKLTKTVPTPASTGQANSGFPSAVARTYVITPTGITGLTISATVRLHYLDTELNGNVEGTMRLWKFIGTGWQQQDFPLGLNTTFDSTDNWVQFAGVTGFSPWAIANVSPTAANGNVSGRIVDSNGNPVEGAGVHMSGTENRLTVTDAQGNYNFANVETNGFYTVTPTRANFSFSPAQRSFSQLGLHTDAAFSAITGGNTANPLDTSEYFVRQQYVDFLNREPDEAGLNFWVNNIDNCGTDAQCREVKRIDTSAAFFLSIEFQQTGYLVFRTYQTAYGEIPNTPVPLRLNEFKSDSQEIGNGVVVLQPGWEQTLENNKQSFAGDFVQRARFAAAYPTTMTPAEFVDRLFANASVTPSDSDRAAAISEFGSATNSSDASARARTLRRVAENSALAQKDFDSAFVLMQYFGYLRRDADATPDTNFDGYNFWLTKLDSVKGNYQQAELVKAFLSSTEYRGRFPR